MLGFIASAGSATTAMEAIASSIGAGAVVGGFLGGLTGFLSGQPTSESEKRGLRYGYFGGAVCLAMLAADILEKSFV
jgi:hypothetical protein